MMMMMMPLPLLLLLLLFCPDGYTRGAERMNKKDMEQNNDIVANNRHHHQKTLFTSQTPDGKKECNMLKLENLSSR
jgi:hypothetical protein